MGTSAARLEVVTGKAAGMSILVEDELVIGRQVEGAGRLADDEEVSRLHARLALDAGGGCTIEDLGSTNGTFVNGVRISAPRILSEGDTVEIGGTTLVLRQLVAAEPAKLSAPEPDMTRVTPGQADAAFQQTPAAAGPSTERWEERAPAEAAAPPEPIAAAEPFSRPEPVVHRETAAPPPEPGVAPEPAPAPQPPPAPAPPTLSLQLEINFVDHEARLALGPRSEPVRFVFEAGAWRLNPLATNQEGGPHEHSPGGF